MNEYFLNKNLIKFLKQNSKLNYSKFDLIYLLINLLNPNFISPKLIVITKYFYFLYY